MKFRSGAAVTNFNGLKIMKIKIKRHNNKGLANATLASMVLCSENANGPISELLTKYRICSEVTMYETMTEDIKITKTGEFFRLSTITNISAYPKPNAATLTYASHQNEWSSKFAINNVST